jgi:CYTH domain-containing protein
MREIERKFLIPTLPEGIASHPASQIRQGYLAIEGDREVRVRARDARFTLATKRGLGLSREEQEIELQEPQFDRLWVFTRGRRVEKTRYELVHGESLIELDVFHGALEGLCVAEVEFGSEREAEAFSPPSWFGIEVTEDGRFMNKNLAQHGRPRIEP